MDTSHFSWKGYIILASFLLTAIADKGVGSKEDIIATDLGIKVEKVGKAILTDEYIIISLVIKLPDISMAGYWSYDGQTSWAVSECRDLRLRNFCRSGNLVSAVLLP